jgi:hypothetical protein
MLSVTFFYCYAECRNAECRYDECRYAKCRCADYDRNNRVCVWYSKIFLRYSYDYPFSKTAQGTLAEEEGSAQLTCSLRQVVS